MLPAAQTTTSRGPLTRLTTPSTSLCAGSGPWPSVYARSTVASHSAASERARSVCSASALQPVKRVAQPLEARARVGEQRHTRVLAGVDRGDVEVDEAHVRAAKMLREAVVKSLQRVPTPRTRSASRAIALAAVVPVAPIAPTACGWS